MNIYDYFAKLLLVLVIVVAISIIVGDTCRHLIIVASDTENFRFKFCYL